MSSAKTISSGPKSFARALNPRRQGDSLLDASGAGDWRDGDFRHFTVSASCYPAKAENDPAAGVSTLTLSRHLRAVREHNQIVHIVTRIQIRWWAASTGARIECRAPVKSRSGCAERHVDFSALTRANIARNDE